ncbi:hypothetical protein [Nonomuraea fuscirosea]|uniref:hypothetical protein n=1 Tax=Nonomuraea fuscirosea TaxID=1291556 RepID=UPI003442C8D4
MKRAIWTILIIICISLLPPGENRLIRQDVSLLMEAWVPFPEERKPRPIVFANALPVVEKKSKGGHITRVHLGTRLTTYAPAATYVTLPDGPASVPQISATEAFNGLVRQLNRNNAPTREDTVIDAEHTFHGFQSDRGPVLLPAWRFRLAGGGSLIWPALSSGAFWRLGELSQSSAVKKATASQTRPEITIWMDPGETCDGKSLARPKVVIAESPDVVVIITVDNPQRREASELCLMPAYYLAKPFTYRLSSPLGNRGLLDELGNVAIVHYGDVAAIPTVPQPTRS